MWPQLVTPSLVTTMSSSLPPASSPSNKKLELGLEEERCFNSSNQELVDFEDGYVPVGVRFFPHDHEVIQPYLLSKILGTKHTPLYPIKDIDLSTFDPNDIVFDEGCRANETYFYAWFVNKRGKGMVQRVVTKGGYWEAGGVDVPVYSDGDEKVMVGFKRNWTFYWGTQPEGENSVWSMTEYRVNPRLIPEDQMNDDIRTNMVGYAVCKIEKLKEEQTRLD